MKNKKMDITFGYKEDLIKYGQDKLCNDMLNVIKDVDKKYIIGTNGMSDKLYKLFGFDTYEELKKVFNKKPVSILESYIKILAENIFKSLEDRNSFIYECFESSWYRVNYRDLNIKFSLETYEVYEEENVAYQNTYLNLSIMSYQKNSGCGGGNSFSFNIIDSDKLNEIVAEVNSLTIPNSLKNLYIEYFNEERESNFNIQTVKRWVKDNIVSVINEFIYENEEKYKQYISLFKQGIKEELIEYLKLDDFTNDILDTITVDYGLKKADWYAVNIDHVGCKVGEYYTNEDKIEIKFLGEVVKTISKTSYTVYEIS